MSPYSGKKHQLICSIDIGTTFSACSYCILQPKQVPKFVQINRWPKQTTSDAKIPSVVYYDKDGIPRAFGAETEDTNTIMQAEEEGWFKAEWWKLWLRPKHLNIIKDLTLPPLPAGKSVDDIFTDFLRYINKQIEATFRSSYGDGDALWASLSPSMYYILSTPNGWEGKQQHRLRKAAIKAGLIEESERHRVEFVSEAEAAILYAVNSGNIENWLVRGNNLILCDCGGGTIDITGYNVIGTKPMNLEESRMPQCLLGGAVRVTRNAENYFRNIFSSSKWGSDDTISRAIQDFEKEKKKFTRDSDTTWIMLDGHGSSTELQVQHGRMQMKKQDMVSLFEPSVQAIIDGLDAALENRRRIIDKVILVGGLSGSPYVYSRICEWGQEHGVSVSRPDDPTAKAVTNGALSWHLEDPVSARISKLRYGLCISQPYDADDPDCCGRPTFERLDGELCVSGLWSCIVDKGVKINSRREFTCDYCIEWGENLREYSYTVDILAYRHAQPPPRFATWPTKKEQYVSGFEVICKITGDLQECYQLAETSTSPSGENYKTLCYDVCIRLGGTEITARLRWKNSQGRYRYGPATVAYE